MVSLDIFKALALYLKADFNIHKLTIFEAAETKDNKKIMTVCKQDASTVRGGYRPSTDKRERAIEEAKHRNHHKGW